jgi:hypothetical protein
LNVVAQADLFIFQERSMPHGFIQIPDKKLYFLPGCRRGSAWGYILHFHNL